MSKYFVSFYRFSLGDCTKGGLSSKYKSSTVVTTDELSKDNDFEENTLVLVKRELFGKNADYVTPLSLYNTTKIVMFGGNYCMGDSRFGNEVSPLPLPVHDRVETQEEYDMYSD